MSHVSFMVLGHCSKFFKLPYVNRNIHPNLILRMFETVVGT
jgi:hypothetical protein